MWLVLRPGFSPQVRVPPTARSAPRGGRRGLLVLTAGPVRCFYRRYPIIRWLRPYLNERARVVVLLPREPTERREGQRTMTRAIQNLVARRRDEFNRDRGSRRLLQVVDARRRLNTGRADSTRTRTDRLGSERPRHAYLTQAND